MLQQKRLTNFEIRTNALPRGSRLAFRSKSVKVDAQGDPVKDKNGNFHFLARNYVNPMRKTGQRTCGKKSVRAVKRAKVAAMKAAQHFKGDNREFVG